ncbi:MAG TPA: hypothetical protein PLU10_06660 [Chitinophagaceae bacterium]|nr:hypothetical protein [Chitinophagaceae bacterium]
MTTELTIITNEWTAGDYSQRTWLTVDYDPKEWSFEEKDLVCYNYFKGKLVSKVSILRFMKETAGLLDVLLESIDYHAHYLGEL